MKNHGIGDVRHMELIKANQPVAFGDTLAQLIKGVHGALQILQFAMHLAHEFVRSEERRVGKECRL